MLKNQFCQLNLTIQVLFWCTTICLRKDAAAGGLIRKGAPADIQLTTFLITCFLTTNCTLENFAIGRKKPDGCRLPPIFIALILKALTVLFWGLRAHSKLKQFQQQHCSEGLPCSAEECFAWTHLPGHTEKHFPYIKTPLLEEGKEVQKMAFPT